MGIVTIRLPSESIFSHKLKTTYIFGIPLYVSAGGLVMDVDRNINVIAALDGDNNKNIRFMLASGINSSALEHSVPERLFSTSTTPVQGISAVKALAIANDQGIPIYTVNQSNINTSLPQLQVDAKIKADIQNAVNAGKIVTVSKTNITFNGWTGIGYIIIDPITGAGAYMISGGLSGAMIGFIISIVINLVISFLITEAVAAQLYEDTYIAGVTSCVKYFHPDEYWACVDLVINTNLNDLLAGFLAATLSAASGAWTLAVVIMVGMWAWAFNEAVNCREFATHCD